MESTSLLVKPHEQSLHCVHLHNDELRLSILTCLPLRVVRSITPIGMECILIETQLEPTIKAHYERHKIIKAHAIGQSGQLKQSHVLYAKAGVQPAALPKAMTIIKTLITLSSSPSYA